MIVKEYLDPEIYLIKNILSKEDLKTLQEFAKNENDWLSISRPEVKVKNLKNINEIERIHLEIFYNFIIPVEPNLEISPSPVIHRMRAKEAQPTLGSSKWGMRPHVDDSSDSTIKKGLIYYINDDFEGGEIVYINKKIKHKPIANSIIVHPATKEYEHGVMLINKGTRYFMTNFYKK